MDTFALKRIGSTNIMAMDDDVTRQPVDGIVNSATEYLQHKEGVATAIVRTGGRVIQEESDAWVREHGPLAPGSAAVTTGGMLQASHVIHTVGPYYTEDSSDPVLESAVSAALDAAVQHELNSIAVPMISSGLRGYPPARAAEVIAGAVTTWVTDHPDALAEVRLVGFGPRNAKLFVAALNLS